MDEIGSEFWQYPCGENYICEPNESVVFLLSGRTALDYLIRDIKAEQSINSVYMPSYCCKSMIEPFLRNGVDVKFYRVGNDGLDYNYSHDCQAVLLLDYFGYQKSSTGEIARNEHNAGRIVIYDGTHKLNNNPVVEAYSSYSLTSYRKWFYCNYAKARKHSGAFVNKQPGIINHTYCDTRDKAAKLKSEYITNGNVELKQEFLRLFSTAESILENDYVDYYGHPVQVDVESIITARRRNAKRLIDSLSSIPEVQLWCGDIQNTDTPLFVPILVEPIIRDDLRSYLIKNGIYCPIHWPLSDLHGGYTDIFNEEISLICDQRYSLDDMDREISVIESFFTIE